MFRFTCLILLFGGTVSFSLGTTTARADDTLQRRASWQTLDAESMSQSIRSALEQLGITSAETEQAVADFLAALQQQDGDALDAFVTVARPLVPVIDELAVKVEADPVEASASIDPNTPGYGALESLPKPLRMSIRTWLGRELVRRRLYDEALPVIAEVDPTMSLDPAAALFYRGACYHALLMKTEALADLRRLLENDSACPIRYSRTAKMMVADIKPLKEDSLDEISRIMTDVTRRLDLGRTDEDVKDREQKIIDKLSKLIDKLEKEQQRQQQQQQQSSGGSQSNGNQGQGAPMDDSRIAGANGAGDVDRKKIEQRDGWGNLPPAERQQALQQIGRDLPTHYREAIEAYFRKLATEGK